MPDELPPRAWRVALRPPAAHDSSVVDGWLGEALAAVAGATAGAGPTSLAGVQQSLHSDQQLWLITLDGEEPVGLIATTTLGRDLASIDALAIMSSRRNLGFGAEAIYALEEMHPATNFLAGVPVENGLAIYFWLRIGYAPLFPRPATSRLATNRLYLARGRTVAITTT